MTDVNDNRPVFQQSSYSTAVSEAQSVGSIVLNLLATDADNGLNGSVIYSIEEQLPQLSGSLYYYCLWKILISAVLFFRPAEPVFVIDNQTGVISLSSPLDRETHDSFSLSVSARDQGTPSLSSPVSHTHRHTHQLANLYTCLR